MKKTVYINLLSIVILLIAAMGLIGPFGTQ